MFDYTSASYTVNKVPGFTLDQALRLWKTRYETAQDCVAVVAAHPALSDLAAHITQTWDSITSITVQEALAERNIEKRRLYFWAIGVIKLFKDLEPELMDKQVISKRNQRWDADNQPYTQEIMDTYELYRIDGNKLFDRNSVDLTNSNRFIGTPTDVYAVRCWCTTTNREYWIYVNREAALGKSWQSADDKADAIRAIAWTIRLDVTKPAKIYRQGDVILAKPSAESRIVSPYHLSKDSYLQLMYSES